MSILTQFLPTVNAQIGEIKTVLRANLFVSGNSTTETATPSVLTDVDGGVWLQTNKTYLRADYPQLANTIGTHGGVNFTNYGNLTAANPWENQYIYNFAVNQVTNEWRLVTGRGQLFGNTAGGRVPDYRGASGNVIYDIAHNSENTGLAGNNWAVVGYDGMFVNDMTYVYDTGNYNNDPGNYKIQVFGVAYGANNYVARGSWGQVYWSTNQGSSYNRYQQANWNGYAPFMDPNFKTYRGMDFNVNEGVYGYSAAIGGIKYGANTFSVLSPDIGLVSFSANGTQWPGVPGVYESWGRLNAIACANNIWVTVGDGSTDSTSANVILATSNDGFIWTRRNLPAGMYDTLRSITFGDNVWVVGTTGGRMIYSPNNGVTWINVANTTGASIHALDFAPNVNNTQMFCYAGASGALGITTNANSQFVNVQNSWISTSQNSGSQPFWTVKYIPGPNIWMTGNNTGDISTSTDGRTWLPRGRIAGDQNIYRIIVANNNTKIVMATSAGYVYSADVANANAGFSAWTGYPGYNNTASRVVYADGLYVTTMNTHGMIHSSDGGYVWNRDSWTLSRVHTSYIMRSLAYSNTSPNKWIAVGDIGMIRLSKNAFVWSGQQMVSSANVMWGAAYGANSSNVNLYVAGGAAGNLAISDDGIYWRAINATTSTINAMYYANGVFFYGAAGGGLASSRTGADWSDASNTTVDLNSVAYGNNVYVIVGNSGVIRTSNNGVYWTATNSNSVQSLTHVEYGGGIFFAVGGSANIVTSTDGTNWIRRTASVFDTSPNTFYAGAYGGTQNLYVIGGQNGNVGTSTDGVTWTGRTSGTSSLIRSIAASPSLFVYGTDGGGLATSTDGITWTSRTSGTTNSIFAVLFARNLYIAAGQSGNLITSTDGTTWTARTSNTSSLIYSLGYSSNSNLFFYGAASGGYGTSTDGITWYANTGLITTILGFAFGNNTNTTVAVGNTGMIRHSQNTISYSGSNSAVQIRAFAYGNGVYMAVGDSGFVRTSTDGLFWDRKDPGTANSFYSAIYAANKFIISGGSGNTRYSVDNGTTWLGADIGTGNLMYTLAAGNGIIVRGGQNGNVGTSTDGITWVQSNVTTVNVFSNLIYSIAFSNVSNTFMYTGQNGRTAVSTNGNAWTTIYPWANTTNQENYEVLYGNNEWMLFGQGGIPIKSVDANNWSTSKTNVEIYGIAAGANVWVAVGANGNVRTSTDGVYWSIQDANANVRNDVNLFGIGNTSRMFCVEYLNNVFLAGGEHGIFRYSTDGYNWLASPSLENRHAVRAVAYGQGRYVAVGNSGFIATTTNLAGPWTEVYYKRTFTGVYPETFLDNRFSKNKSNLVTVVYNPTLNIFVAGGENRTYLTSTDGLKWINRTGESSRFPHVGDQIFNISNGDNGKLALVGNRSQFQTSTDGIRWGGNGATSNGWGTVGWQQAFGLTYDSNTKLYCVASGGLWSTSTDLWHWEPSASRNPGWVRLQSWQGPDHIQDMVFGNTTAGGNVTISVGPVYGQMLWSRLGGRLWNTTTFDDRVAPFRAIRGMKFANNRFVAACDAGRLIQSLDGIHWERVNTGSHIFGTRGLVNVNYGNGQWIVVGAQVIAFSRDLINWTKGITSYGDFPGGPGFVYTSAMISPNVSMIGTSGGNTYYTFKSDPSKPTTVFFDSGQGIGYDEDAEFYIPRINVSNYIVSGNFQGSINFSNAVPTTGNTGNLMCEVVTYIKAK